MKIYQYLLISVLLITVNGYAKKDKDEVNYLELASLMLKDDNLDRAETALSQVDTTVEDFDMQRFYIINALLNIKKTQNEKAIEYIQKAKQLGPVDAVINVYLAQAAYSTEKYQLAIDALDAAGTDIARIPSIYHMKAQSYWNLEKQANAIAILEQAEKIFPEDNSFPRRKIFFYIELGYNKEAMQLGYKYLQKFDGSPEDYIAIGNAIKSSGDSESALEFLEDAKMRFPHNNDISKTLAAVYINQEDYFTAAQIIHEASLTHTELTKEASELYRRAGNEYLALTLNSLIEDQAEKFKQRLALLIQLENFEQAAAMEDHLKRTHVESDDSIKYALAYSFFKTGNYDKAENYLSKITDSEVLTKGIELRKFMENCRENIWSCQ